MEKVFAFDVDGVLLNFMKSFDQASEIVLKRPIVANKDETEQDHYHLGKRVGTTEDNVRKILNYMLESRMYAEFEPLEGVKESLKKIREKGYKMVIVTALPETAKEMRLENLKKALDFVPDDSHFVGMGLSKTEALKKSNPDIFIDDRLAYLANAPEDTYHLIWCDQKESQEAKEVLVNVHVHSLKEWVDNHLELVDKKLTAHKIEKEALQTELRLESYQRKYPAPK